MDNQIPLPLFKLNRQLLVTHMHDPRDLFGETPKSFEELADEGSREKCRRMFEASVERTELNMITAEGVRLCELFITETADGWSVLLVPASNSYLQVADKLEKLQSRLAETNFELFEKSESLSQAVKRSNKLSGPFIELTDGLAIVPLFGDLSFEKLDAIQSNVLKRSYHAQPERILIDFTGVGVIELSSVGKLRDFLLIFEQLGISTVVIGLHPAHARTILPYRRELNFDVERSAKEAVRQWLLSDEGEESPYVKTEPKPLNRV
ncbi:STAS domain-containing protein [Alkalicoccus luteus]|uniref:STAS domain-containing protein n=1 Tax=Alkalicoccus luteus TaxID=1237094 RepID=A0A969TWF2_9BACI|nr:STAS domain-containing protein [Alkalicoccus luteus]NJP37239.1 STAS domain-containing protein [Alkalicoccus luteus]